MKQVVAVVVAIAIVGCSSTTVINSEPSGANLYMNGEKVGTTPYAHTDRKIIGATTIVTLKKEGHDDFTTSFSRNEEISVGAIIGGFLVLVPFLWTMEYKPVRNYEMVPLKNAVNPE